MNLWFSHFLVVGLVLTTSALTPEECEPLIKPLPLADSSVLHGRLNLMMGYSDNDEYNVVLNSTESFWMKMTPSASNKSELSVHEEDKINGSCLGFSYNTTFDIDSGKLLLLNISTVIQVLPCSDSCVVLNVNNTASNLGKLFRQSNIDITGEEVTIHSLYLMARETTVKPSDLEQFKQQASCLGFTGEPSFSYDHKYDFCAEGEDSHVSL